jgi:hypothetical protein
MTSNREQHFLFGIGDYLAGGATGAATAAVVRAVVSPTLDMVVAMMVGMILGMVIHIVIAAVLSPVLGFFHLMVPGSLIGMYGGMLFAMRDTMQHPADSLGQASFVGVLFGFAVVAGVHLYDRALQQSHASGDAMGGL